MIRNVSLLLLFFVFSAVGVGAKPSVPTERFATDDWSEARKTVQKSPWKEWLKGEEAALDDWMQGQRDSASWSAGWAHDFVDAQTGAFIPWTPSTDCIQYGVVNSKMFSACMMMQRTYNIKAVARAARLGELLDNSRYREWAAAQLDLYHRLYSSSNSRTRGTLFTQLLDEATVTSDLTTAVRLLRPHVHEERANGWCVDFLRTMARAMLNARRQVSNITAWYDVAAASVAMTCRDEPMREAALSETPLGLIALLNSGLSDDGFWYELSPQYQRYVASALIQLLINASIQGQASSVITLWPRLRAMLAAPMALSLGDGAGPITNDMNKALPLPDTTLLLDARRVVPSAGGERLARTTLDWPQLLDPPSASADPSDDPPPPSTNAWVDGARTLMLRSDGWSGLIRGGQIAPFHAHQDTLSIELKYGSTWLFRNSVTPGYGSELQRNFYKRAAAVSTPLVDSNGTSNWFRPLASYRVEPALVSGQVTSFAKDVTVERSLAVEGSGALKDTATFTTTQSLPRVFSQLYHSDCTLPDFPVPPTTTAVQKISPYLLNWEQLNSATKYWTLRLSCGGKTFLTTLSGSRAFSVWRADGPALGPARRRMALLIELEPGASGWLSARFEPAN